MSTTPSSPSVVAARAAAYRRLTLAILALDVPTLTADLRAQRLGPGRPTPLVTPQARRAA